VTDEKDLAGCGTAGIDQQALADALPEATVRGIAAGLHVTVELPDHHDEHAILDEARNRRIDLTTMGEFWAAPGP
jgi:GntR family transcriptional regulator/MocR family aminotransferase